MEKYREITIDWSYPIAYDNIFAKEGIYDIGIYYISRKFGDKESILYIGKSTYSFFSRLISHKKNWLDSYRGEKFVRLGRIVNPKNISDEGMKSLIDDAEKTIIFYLSNVDEHNLVANVISTQTTNFDTTLQIKNIGYRGQLPRDIYIPEEMLIFD